VGERRDPAAGARLENDIIRLNLTERVTVIGTVASERLAALYADANLFVLASRFEGYGMAYAEAIANGLPVIGTTAGAIPETAPAGAGILVPPDDVIALEAALRRLVTDPQERNRLAAGARSAAASLPTWTESARVIARALANVA